MAPTLPPTRLLGMLPDEEEAIERLLRSEEEAEESLAILQQEFISASSSLWPHRPACCAEYARPARCDADVGADGIEAGEEELQELCLVNEKLRETAEELEALAGALRDALAASSREEEEKF